MTLPQTQVGFETRQLAPGVTLHSQESSKLKTNLITLSWVADLRADVTARALLASLLTRGTSRYPSLRDVTRRLQELYGASFTSSVMKVGERHVIGLRLEFANDLYLPEGESILGDVVSFLHEVISRPRLESGVFPGDLVDQEKVFHQRDIESLFNDKGAYALERCVEEMCADEEFRRYEYGRVEDLPGITPKELTELWRRQLTRAETHVYFSGDVSTGEVDRALSGLMTEREGEPIPVSDLAPLRRPSEVREVAEAFDLNQAKLVLGYRTGIRFGDQEALPLTVANGLLGGFTHSKLFQNVREKESLCYYAASRLDRTQGLLLITSGIEHARYQKARDLIQAQVKDIQDGKISDDELTHTLTAFDNRLGMLEDSPQALMGSDLVWRLSGVEYDHGTYREGLSRVTRDDVVEAMRRAELDTVYLLHPKEGK